MAVTRRASAAYASIVAVTAMHNTTARDGKHSRGSIGWYERDENIINGSKQNPFTEYNGNSDTNKEIAELPKILVEPSPDINEELSSEECAIPQIPSDVYNNCDAANAASVVSAMKAQNCPSTHAKAETAFTLYENPLSDELRVTEDHNQQISV